MSDNSDGLVTWVRTRLAEPDLRDWVADVLMDLCEVDTSLGPDLDRLAANEKTCFHRLTEAMTPFLPGQSEVGFLSVPEEIAEDPYFTVPYYAGESRNDLAAVYAGRANLLVDAAGNSGPSWVLNAHVDTVPPHIPPHRTHDGRVAGRGSADDKNGLVTAAAVARLISEWQDMNPLGVAPRVRYLISIDEEMGGNGSLGAVRSLDLRNDRVVVMEPTSSLPYPANRGAIWFEVRMDTARGGHAAHWGLCKELALSLARAGRDIQKESEHPLFSSRDVQTCFGVIGPFGRHPSSACDRIELEWEIDGDGARSAAVETISRVARLRLDEAVEDGRVRHAEQYPSAALVPAPDGGERVRLSIVSRGGHMGSHERDTDAIAKAAECIEAIEPEFGLPLWPDTAGRTTLEGGQGFLPDKTLEQVRTRLSEAFQAGLQRARQRYGWTQDELAVAIHFHKLNNAAFCSAPDAVAGPALARAIGALGDGEEPSLRGWKASCDARIFARDCSDVVTFGPGALEVAHSAEESIDIADICRTAAAIAVAILSDPGVSR